MSDDVWDVLLFLLVANLAPLLTTALPAPQNDTPDDADDEYRVTRDQTAGSSEGPWSVDWTDHDADNRFDL